MAEIAEEKGRIYLRMNAKRKLTFNTITSLVYEIVAIICGFVLPRLVLSTFGSETNGLVNSVSQFLSVISFLNLGVGAVLQSTLYKPLAENDTDGISRIVASGQKFFTKIAFVLSAYVILLAVLYPLVSEDGFSYFDVFFLILAMSINMFAQYYFGIVDGLLLVADQKGYIQYSAQIIALLLNTVACVVIIKLGASIQIVKLTTSVIFLLQPLALHFYVNKHYKLNRKIKYEGEPIKQKWNGLAQHLASVVLDGTDIIVLTFFSTLSNVSIYSVFNLIVGSIKKFFISLSSGVQSLIGELWAKSDLEKLKIVYFKFEWILHTVTIFVFMCTAMLIVPFVRIYTDGINDADYMQTIFAYLITAANASHCIRLPYNIMILATGEYKRTQHIYIIAAAVNIVISIICVFFLGLIGVAIGTLVSMAYQTTAMAIFNNKYLLHNTLSSFLKHILIDVITIVCIYASTFWIELGHVSYLSWIIMAFEIAGLSFTIILIVNLIFYRKNVFDLFTKSVGVFKNKSKKVKEEVDKV